ncbi:MAG: 50S ribosomal protein L18e [Nitrososphaerota archaeon]|jgi:large subunit ribosomal protein L18e|uniref:50S ribosomal protein L18e n=1 Tax=Candidatus Bathycorpusculum sp. TaxID=2994959 RepID=UPI002826AB98|nr:50S ribosomal protein L18e [Candidatus Termiticorpusculum sp.]MCL2256956.1 50S ribosomal protein L18e [Candidatus Termiticorpusculum sp.]MCL2292920.1 50S ribosomal protein L18e [Candidatus Termiticorpusculum sp.]MDR0460972.1 50S ribosomal protein L18e [Nitrososphaerota archaeon]
MKQTESTNPELIQLIKQLKKESREKDVPIWRDVAEQLSQPRSRRAAVNLSSINRNTQRADTIVVPGKILGTGSLTHPITVAAFSISETAKAKLDAIQAKYVTISELVTENPKGSNIKIIR